MSDIARLIAFATQAKIEDLDQPTLDRARMMLMDTIGVGVAGATHKGVESALIATHRWGKGEDARVLGRAGVRLSAASAALINGYQIHCLEWDGLHDPSVVIALCTTVAALLAEIEVRVTTGEALLLAFAIGVEVAVLMGAPSRTQPRFFRPAVCGLMGAAIAVARIRKFTPEQMSATLGLAYSQLSGTMQAHWEGASNLALQVGIAARAAVMAGDLVEAGMTGPTDVLTGKFGFFTLFETATAADVDAHIDRLGKPWKITEISHKPFPAGRASQATLTALAQLRSQVAFGADDVDRICVHAPPLIHLLVGRPLLADMTAAYARLCLRFVAPLFILHGAVDPRLFKASTYADPALVALAAKIALVPDGNQDPNALGPQRVELWLTDGRHLWIDVDAPLGAPANPLDHAGQLAKLDLAFALSATPLDPAPFVAAMNDIASLENAAELLDTCTNSISGSNG